MSANYYTGLEFVEGANAVRAELPLLIDRSEIGATNLILAGKNRDGVEWALILMTQCSLSTEDTVVTWGDDSSASEKEVARLVGQKIVKLEGPEDLFDAKIILESGDSIRQLCSDSDPDAWMFDLKDNWFFTGPLPVHHRAWLGVKKSGLQNQFSMQAVRVESES